MKILFISDFILAEEQGAKKSTRAHYESLKDIFGADNVQVVALNSTYSTDDINIIYKKVKQSKLKILESILLGVPFLMSKSDENEILRLCKINDYALIFVDHSIYGSVIEKIRKVCDTPVVSYFH